MTFQVELVSPEDISYSGEAEMVIARTVEGGDIAFQPGHVPFLSVWSVEVIRPDGERDVFAVHRGFVQVAGTKVSILSDVSETADEIDIERAKEARVSAKELIQSNSEDQEAIASLERSEVRLRVAGVEV
jgi:F-type H+-transporting ATPase subunit epsilon